MKKRKIRIEQLQLRAGFKPSTFDESRNTVDVVWTTGSRVKRFSFFDGEFYEELSLKRGHVRLDRLKNGAPLLNNHRNWGGLEDIIGVVEQAKIENGVGVATVRLSDRENLRGIVNDIKSGIIRNVSVGYRVNKFEELKEKSEDGLPVLRAVDWEPMELSFVGIPADSGAQSRHDEQATNECEIINEREENMGKKKAPVNPSVRSESDAEQTDDVTQVIEQSEETQEEQQDAPASEESEGAESPAESTDESQAEAAATSEEGAPESQEGRANTQTVETATVNAEEIRKAEMTRQSDIRKAVRLASLGEEFADELVADTNCTVEKAREAIFKKLESQTSTRTMNQRIEVTDMDQKELRRKAAVAGILHRAMPEKYTLKDGEREFAQGSIVDTARHFLHLEGVRDAYKMPRTELAKRALHHISDFPLVLENIATKSLRDAYEGAPNTYSPFVTPRTVADFKEISSVQLSNGGKLEKVNEHGEYKRTTLAEAAEKYKVEKFGLIIGRTYELIVNDDLDAFTRVPARLGVRAREKENEIFWGLVIANQTMAEDGNGLFHSSRNLSSTSDAIAIASLGAGRAAMRLFLDLDGELMNLSPSYLVVPAAKETVADQFVSQITPDQAGQVNPFAGRLRVLAEPRLDAASTTAWHLFADSSKLDMAEIARLEGVAGPEVFAREGFDIDGMEVKIRHQFGMRIVDWRGFWKNPGA